MSSTAEMDTGSGTRKGKVGSTTGDDSPERKCGVHVSPRAAGLAARPSTPHGIDLPGHGRGDRLQSSAGLDFRGNGPGGSGRPRSLRYPRGGGVGGSLGSGVAVPVDDERPGLWERLLLAEPVAFPPDSRPPPGRNPWQMVLGGGAVPSTAVSRWSRLPPTVAAVSARPRSTRMSHDPTATLTGRSSFHPDVLEALRPLAVAGHSW